MSTHFKFTDEKDTFNIVLACRAIWLLYKRRKWDLLAELGLPKETHQQQFLVVEMLIHRVSPTEEGEGIPVIHLSHPRHIVLLLECDGMVEAAITLQARYLREKIKQHEYAKQAKRHEIREESRRTGTRGRT